MLNEDELKELFALIPENEAQKASSEVLEQLSQMGSRSDNRIAWVDFDGRFEILSAGISEIGKVSSLRIIKPSDSERPEVLENLIWHTQRDMIRSGDIFLSDMLDRIIWIVPFGLATAAGATVTRSISVGFDVLYEILDSLNPTARLTHTEKRVTCHTLAGLTPKQSAELDKVHWETRRGQLKQVCAKLSVSGQNSLVRLVMSQMVHLLFYVEEEKRQSADVASFATTHFPKNVRLILWRLPDGRTLRVFEAGDKDGLPVLMQHGLFFVPLVQSLAPHAAAHGLRLVLPLRSGYWSQQSLDTPVDTLKTEAQWDADLKAYIEGKAESGIIMVGHSMGCVHSLRFAARYPKLLRNLVLLSPYFGRAPRNTKTYLSRIMKVLDRVRSNQFLFRIVASQFAHSYSNNRIAQSALYRIFRDSAEDIKVLKGAAAVPAFDPWFSSLFRSSVNGIAQDFQSTLRFDPQSLKHIPAPCMVIYGDQDPIAWEDEIESTFGRSGNHKSTCIPGSGHFLMVTARNEILSILSSLRK
ncbi:MAG: alpha/beta hydrolase [Pseudomonadota bacterium]